MLSEIVEIIVNDIKEKSNSSSEKISEKDDDEKVVKDYKSNT